MRGGDTPILGNVPPPQPDVLKTLASYIPSEVLTIYLAGVVTINTPGVVLPGGHNVYQWSFFWICLLLSPLLASLGVWVASKTTPTPAAVIFPTFSATVAFAAYALAVPNGPIGTSGLGALAILIVTPMLYASSLAYQRFFPPPKGYVDIAKVHMSDGLIVHTH